MKTYQKLCVLGLTIFLLSADLLANERGNGGDAVVCRDSEGRIISAELLDYYEGRTRRNFTYDEDYSSYEEMVNEKQEELKKYDPSLVQKLEINTKILIAAAKEHERTLEMRIGEVLFTHESLVDIPDSEHLNFPTGCDVEQVVIKLIKAVDEDPLFMIQKDIWDALPAFSTGGLILHEGIFQAFLAVGHKNSIKARYFNQRLNLKNFSQIDYPSYLELAADSGLPLVKNGENYLLPNTLMPYQKNKSYYVCQSKNAYLPNQVFDRNGVISDSETIEANPRTIYLQMRLSKAHASMSLTVDGKQVCDTRESTSVQRTTGFVDDTNIDHIFGCSFVLLKGDHTYQLRINTESKNRLYYWVINDRPIPVINTAMMLAWFWLTSPVKIGMLAGESTSKKIKDNKPLISSGSFYLY